MPDKPTPINPAVDAEDEAVFNYRLLNGDQQVAQLENALRERETMHYNCMVTLEAMTAIPADMREQGESAEIERLKRVMKALEFGINRLRAMKALM